MIKLIKNLFRSTQVDDARHVDADPVIQATITQASTTPTVENPEKNSEKPKAIMSKHAKYVQLSPGMVRFSMQGGRIIAVLPNYTKLYDEPQPITDDSFTNFIVEVDDEIYFEVNGQGQLNVGPKGGWGSKHEFAQVPIESLIPIDSVVIEDAQTKA